MDKFALEVFSDLSERLNYNLPGFPLYAKKGALHQFDRFAAAYHWHPDLEFIVVLDGTMDFYVNGQTVHLDKGNGIFVNSKRLHYGFSAAKSDCTFLVIVIHPALLGENTLAGKAYLEEKLGSGTGDFLLLSSQTSWQHEILLALTELYDEMHSHEGNLLRLLSQAVSICAGIADHIQQAPGNPNNEQIWITIRKMTGYIHQHYESKLTIDEIAAAGSVCRSRCCELFKKHVGWSPNNYLTRYRLQKSCEMLKETTMPVGEIAMACGFQTASYFSHVFGKQLGQIPQDFRKQSAAAGNDF
ncbi:AraC family transcriptional regulator [Paenibacillus sp. FSL R7-0337]|uniref:AraC family transcriptional regulator n=1 Tax=Paenibacillus sp. FSL R7-0337 TaxID=1926588 RepID=UPI00096BED3D|nr:AraC family transcriptional regulator [Paenibacillus sp. FSL R7-0337]OMG00888.1 AraC family transcriptional regulator [Paenibacillus sp. FSL R7-0337]